MRVFVHDGERHPVDCDEVDGCWVTVPDIATPLNDQVYATNDQGEVVPVMRHTPLMADKGSLEELSLLRARNFAEAWRVYRGVRGTVGGICTLSEIGRVSLGPILCPVVLPVSEREGER